ncbi:hypothetical protein Tco_0006902 [Tanacetum coccineum]
MISHEYRSPIKEKLRNLKSRYIHEGRVVFNDFADLNYVRSLFSFVEFECLLEINDQICPRFILEFFSQYQLNYSDEGQMFVEFVIQNQFFSYSLKDFAQILDIPCEGACVFTDKWSLEELAYGVPMDGPYQTNPPYPDNIISSIRIDREGQVSRISHKKEIDVHEYQILTREILTTFKPLEEIIWENVFCLGVIGTMFPRVFVICFIVLYTPKSSILPISWQKRMEWVTKQKRLILPYGMLLTRLFKFVMNENHELYNESYVLYDRVMNSLTAQQERKTRKDLGMRRGRHSTSSSSAFDQPSSSHLNDDDDGNDKGTLRASTPSPIRYVNSLTNKVPQVFQNPPNIEPHLEPFYTRQTEIINRQVQIRDEHRGGLSDEDVTTTPSPTTTSSSPTPPNAPSKTTSTNQTLSSRENTSSSFQSKLLISPPSSNEPTSPHLLNPFLDNISVVPPRPSNPQPLQSHPSLDITLSLSPIIPLDHIHSIPSPPSSP